MTTEKEDKKADEIMTAILGYIRESQSMLMKSDLPGEKTVHRVRVLMKQSRAALTLLSPQFDQSVTDDIQNALKEPGRSLRTLREASVHKRNLKKFLKRNSFICSRLKGNIIITSLLRRKDNCGADCEKAGTLCCDLIAFLEKTVVILKLQSIEMISDKMLMNELEMSFRNVMDYYLMSRNHPGTRNLHEYRKIAKNLLYQLAFFRHQGISGNKRLEKRLKVITLELGRYHDLAGLIKKLSYKYPGSENNRAMDELVALIREEQDKSMFKIFPASYKIFFREGFNLPA
jgi:CHAD domain-containing protein